jgi:hypothetical protein
MFQNPKCFLNVEKIKSAVKKKLINIPVRDFKNFFEQWMKCWEQCKELEGVLTLNSVAVIRK